MRVISVMPWITYDLYSKGSFHQIDVSGEYVFAHIGGGFSRRKDGPSTIEVNGTEYYSIRYDKRIVLFSNGEVRESPKQEWW